MSVAGISGQSDETLGKVNVKLMTAWKSVPCSRWKPYFETSALFSDWFINGDGLLAIHREDML